MIWFTTAYVELSTKRNCFADLDEQLRLHEGLYAQASGDPYVRSANRMMETSRMLYLEATKGYNNILHKPMNSVPALMMGFKSADENHTK